MQRLSTITQRSLIALGTTAILALGIAQAQPTTAQEPMPTMAPVGAQLTIRDVYDRVEAAGYQRIREIEWDDGRYEVKARDAQGVRVKLYVDGDTGTITPRRQRN